MTNEDRLAEIDAILELKCAAPGCWNHTMGNIIFCYKCWEGGDKPFDAWERSRHRGLISEWEKLTGERYDGE